MKLYLFYLIGGCFAILIESAELDNKNKCTTPNGGEGTCILAKSCSYIVDIVSKGPRPLPQSTVEHLRNHGCGFEGHVPKVCCPSNSEGPPDVTNHKNIGLINQPYCGPVETDKIFRGNASNIFEHPWMALISYNITDGLSFRCAGTLINEYYVLTAAHCITGLQSSTSLAGVRLGEHDITKEIDCEDYDYEDICVPPVQDLRIAEVIPHPEYNSSNLAHDIGLLRLDSPANLTSESVKPICLPTGLLNKNTLTGQRGSIMGWGSTEKGISSPVLLQARFSIISLENCSSIFNPLNLQVNISARHICVESKESHCFGDSGGPLTFVNIFDSKSEYRFYQFGVDLFKPRSCGREVKYPEVYTRVDYYMDWILDNMKP